MPLPIHIASYTGNKSLLKKLTRKLTPRLLEIKEESGKTPLMIAVLRNNIDCVRVLLKAGVHVDNFDASGRTALHFATKKGFHRCVKLLLSYNASYELNDYSGNTPLHFAAINKNSKCLQAFLKAIKPGEADIQDSSKRTALHWCSAYANPVHIKLLLSKGAHIGVPDCDGKTPLHWAAANPNARAVECVKLLMERQRTLLINWQDYEGRSALHLAVATGSLEVVNFLVSKITCNPDIYDNLFCTPLHWAARKNLCEKADLLLKKGTYTTSDDNGATPIHYAAYYDHAKILEVFLSRIYIYDIEDFHGRNAFMWAAAKGSDNVINIMIKRGSDLSVKDKDGLTALHIAAVNDQLSTIKLLVNHNVPVDSNHNKEEVTPLMKACEFGRIKAALLLIELGANMNAVDVDSRSALHWCAIGGYAYLCQILLQKGMPCNIKDDFGRTPLHYACMQKGFLNCVSVLLESGAEINVADDEGRFPLHYAILADHSGIVKLLCDYEADVNVLSLRRDWITPLDMAVMKGNPKVLTTLKFHGGLRIKEIKEIAAKKIQNWYQHCRNLKIKYLLKEKMPQENIRILSPDKLSRIPVFANKNHSKPRNRIHDKFSQQYKSSKANFSMSPEQAVSIIERAWKRHSMKTKFLRMRETVKRAFVTPEQRKNAEDLWQIKMQSFLKKL